MDEFDPNINVDILTKARDSNYVVKEVEIEYVGTKIETPCKIIEGKHINQKLLSLIGKIPEKPIFESGVYVVNFKTWRRLKYLLEEAEEDKITGLDKLFGIRKSLWDNSLTTVSIVFARNPFVKNIFSSSGRILEPIEKECYESLLDYINEASSAFVLSPDIRIRKDETGKEIITLNEYIKFIDENVKILSERNKKPIFVPIQIHLSQKRLRKILEHYKNQGYTNIWVNFNASHIGGTYFTRVRTFLRILDRIIGLDKAVLYFTHIKKEINPHVKDERTVASDVLSQFFAADFIGINREPPRNIPRDSLEEIISKSIMRGEFKSEEEYQISLKLHKSRIFDAESYYYYRLDKYPHTLPLARDILLQKIEVNKLVNSLLLHSEVERVRNIVEEKRVLTPYLKEKDALKDILHNITEGGGSGYDLLEFLGKL